MWGDQSVDYGERAYDLKAIPSRHSHWKCMELSIVGEYERRLNARHGIKLMVVHPKDMVLNAAVVALDMDDWNPEWPMPFFCRFESRNGGVWIIMEAMPELLLAN